MMKAGLEAVPHAARPVNNNLYQYEKPENAHYLGRSGSESDLVMTKSEPMNQADDHFPFVDSCLPHVKAFSYVWFHLQAAKRQYFKKCERKMPLEEELKLKNKLQSELQETKQRWATRLLAKLRKDIDAADREKLAQCLGESSRHSHGNSQAESRQLPCVLSIPDLKGKMRRIDCLRQADKVWRLDIVLAVLFRAVPLESTDGERVEKSLSCKQPLLCVNPFHLNVGVRELDMFLSNYLFNFEIPVSFLSAPKANQAQFVAVTDGVYSRCVFGARELLELSQMPINTDSRTFPGATAALPTSNAMTQSNGKAQGSSKPQSAFKSLLAGNGNRSDQLGCDKDDGGSDEEVASLVGPPPGGQYSVPQRVSGPIRPAPPPQQQPHQQSSNRQQQGPPGNYGTPSSGSYNANRVVVVPSHGMPQSSGSAQHSFQPIRSSPPTGFIKQEIQEGNASFAHPQEARLSKPGHDSGRLEDFANFVVEAASRSNSPVRKQPRMSMDALNASSSADFDLGGPSNGPAAQAPGIIPSGPFQLGGIGSPSLMMHAGMMMINGMHAAAAAAANPPAAPPPPPTHPLLYSPNPFSLFSSPAITPRTTPRSTPVPNPQSTIAAAIASAAAQFGADSTENADRERQLQLAAGLFEQNLRVFGLLGAVSGSGQNSGSGLFRSPGFSGLGGLASGIGSALMSAGPDTGNAGRNTPAAQRSPNREMLIPVEPAVVANGSNSNSSNDAELTQVAAQAARTNGNFDSMWSNNVETPQISSGTASGNGLQPNLSASSSNSGDEAFVARQTTAVNQASPSQDEKNTRCKPNLLLASSNVSEGKV